MSDLTVNVPSQAIGDVNKLIKIRQKIANEGAKINFNKRCNWLGITPKYARIKIRNKSPLAQIVKCRSEQLWLKLQIRESYKTKDLLFREARQLQSRLENNLTHGEFKQVSCYINRRVERYLQPIRNRHEKKIVNLCAEFNTDDEYKVTEVHKFHERVVNLTNITFSKDEQDLIDKGLSYNVCPTLGPNTVKEIIAETKLATELAKMDKFNAHNVAVKTKKWLTAQCPINKVSNKDQITLNNINKKTHSRTGHNH